MDLDSVDILHLSDIHAGSGELIDEDGKTTIPNGERHKQLTRLSAYIENLPRKPDYVIISGDITIRGQVDGLELFRDWVFKHIEGNQFPPAHSIVIVPGNHDVTRQTRVQTSKDSLRFRNFFDAFGLDFPHAYIPELDPALGNPDLKPYAGAGGLVGGIRVRNKQGRKTLQHSYPFIFDIKRGLFIFAFNSSLGCGVPLTPNPQISEPLEALINIHAGDTERSQLEKVRDAYLESLIIDAGLITDSQIAYFASTVSKLRSKYGDDFERATKVAVLHHHIGHLWKQQLELKSFETTVDAAQLKQALIETSFDIVLHGHKHTNHVGLEGGLIPVSDSTQFNPLCVISGGTVGGNPRLGDSQTFKLLRLPEVQNIRTHMLIMEVPIRQAANPGSAIRREAKTYNAPLSQKLPSLHRLGRLKSAVDEFVLRKCAPELYTSPTAIISQKPLLEARNPKLFSGSLRYECFNLLDDGVVKRFYEIVLATKAVGFRTISRLHWLVSDVLLEQSDNKKMVVLVIGNLEKTHYSEVEAPNEIAISIELLRGYFRPALISGYFEIREHTLRQDDLTRIVRDVRAGDKQGFVS